MEVESARLTIFGLSRLEVHQLDQQLGTGTIDVVLEESEGNFGDFTTVAAVVVLGQMALKVLAAWLVKTRSKVTLTQVVQIERPDGTVIRETLALSGLDSEASAAAKLEELLRPSSEMPKTQ